MVSITECGRAILWSINIIQATVSDEVMSINAHQEQQQREITSHACKQCEDNNQYWVYKEVGWTTHTFVLLGVIHRTFDPILDEIPLS